MGPSSSPLRCTVLSQGFRLYFNSQMPDCREPLLKSLQIQALSYYTAYEHRTNVLCSWHWFNQSSSEIAGDTKTELSEFFSLAKTIWAFATSRALGCRLWAELWLLHPQIIRWCIPQLDSRKSPPFRLVDDPLLSSVDKGVFAADEMCLVNEIGSSWL